jgi:hypothetical protein
MALPLPPNPTPNTISCPPPTFPANHPLPINHHVGLPFPPPCFGSLPAQIGWPFPQATHIPQTENTFIPQIPPQANPLPNIHQT